MSNDTLGPRDTLMVIDISPEVLLNKSKRKSKLKETCSALSALLNSHGGTLKLVSSEFFPPGTLGEFCHSIEQKLFFNVKVSQYCRIKLKDNKTIICNVKPGDRVYTVQYNLTLPTNFSIRKVLQTEPIETIARVLKPDRPFVNVTLQNRKTIVKEFVKESIMPVGESDTVQFKELKSDKSDKKSLADRMITNKVPHYVAAFANEKGGHTYIGIEDKTRKVCGEKVGKDEQKDIEDKVGSAIQNMIWPDGKPKRGRDWDISFLPVLNSNKEAIPGLFVIIVEVTSCPGGVFLSVPEAYEIRNGKVEPMKYETWKKRILVDCMSFSEIV